NRMFLPYVREAQFLVEEGAAPEAVDSALYDFGMAMGPLAVGDMAGIDVAWRIRKEFRHLEKPGARQPYVEDKLCEMGRVGQKTGSGWYKYDAEGRADSRRGLRAACRRYRHDLSERLRIPRLPRRADVVCGHRRREKSVRPRLRISQAAWNALGARAPAEETGGNRREIRRVRTQGRGRDGLV